MFLFIGKDERPKWKRALEAFKRASAVYKAKHNKPSVIIYDNIAKLELANVNPKVLYLLVVKGVYLEEWNLVVPGHVRKNL